jgi:hypothetical protein
LQLVARIGLAWWCVCMTRLSEWFLGDRVPWIACWLVWRHGAAQRRLQ